MHKIIKLDVFYNQTTTKNNTNKITYYNRKVRCECETHRLLGEIKDNSIEIKCPKCGKINIITFNRDKNIFETKTIK